MSDYIVVIGARWDKVEERNGYGIYKLSGEERYIVWKDGRTVSIHSSLADARNKILSLTSPQSQPSTSSTTNRTTTPSTPFSQPSTSSTTRTTTPSTPFSQPQVSLNPFNPNTLIVSTPTGPAIVPRGAELIRDEKGSIIGYEDTAKQQTVLFTSPSSQSQTTTRPSSSSQTSTQSQTRTSSPSTTITNQQSTPRTVEEAIEYAKNQNIFLTYDDVAKRQYESSSTLEKFAYHYVTFFSSKGWEYTLSALPNQIEQPIRSGVKTVGEKLGIFDIFGFSQIDTTPKHPSQIVKEKISEMHSIEIYNKPAHEKLFYTTVEFLTSPFGTVLTGGTANVIGSKLVSKLGTSVAKKFISVGTAGTFEGGIMTASATALEAYKKTGDIKAAAIAGAVGGIIGGALGFFSAGALGALYPLSATRGGAVGRAVVNTVAYTLDFPEEPLSDLFTYGLTKAKVITPPTPSLTQSTPAQTHKVTTSLSPADVFLPVNVPTNTPTKTKTSTPTHVPIQTPAVVPTPVPEKTKTPAYVPTHIPTDVPTHVPTKTPIDVPTYTPTPTPVPTNVPTITPTVVPTPKIPLLPFLPLPLKEGQGREGYEVRVKSKFVDETALMRKIISRLFI